MPFAKWQPTLRGVNALNVCMYLPKRGHVINQNYLQSLRLSTCLQVPPLAIDTDV